MSQQINILAISGSTRKQSSNLNLINAIAKLAADKFRLIIYEGLTELPHFNPDLDNENPALQVANLRKQLRDADGILICTPEYAMGVPGTLKNAIDWTVSSMEFSQKPVALITASLSGEKAHDALSATLLLLESRMTQDTQLLISFIKTKVNEQEITDVETLANVKKLIDSLTQLANNHPAERLSAPILINGD